MSPTILSGDIVFYKPVKNVSHLFLEGKIVVIKDPLNSKELLLKRVHRVTNKGIEIRGDNFSSSIDSRKFGLVSPIGICGIVERVISLKSR